MARRTETEQITVHLSAETAELLDAAMKHKLLPYRNKSDFFEEAAKRLLQTDLLKERGIELRFHKGVKAHISELDQI